LRHWSDGSCRGMRRWNPETRKIEELPSPRKGSPYQPRQVSPQLVMAEHVLRLEKEFCAMKINDGIMKFREVYGGFPGAGVEEGENWVFPSDLLDICSVVHLGLQYQLPDAGIEAHGRLYRSMACDHCTRIHRLPKTFRIMKKRIMKGFDESSLVKYEYRFPDSVPISNKTASFVLKKFPALINDLLEDPRLMEQGNFYFGDGIPDPGEWFCCVLCVILSSNWGSAFFLTPRRAVTSIFMYRIYLLVFSVIFMHICVFLCI